MKNFLAFVLSIMMVLSLAACGGKTADNNSNTQKPQESEPSSNVTESEPDVENNDTTITPENGDDHTHDYIKTVVEPTCEQDGYTSYSCECGAQYTENVVLAQGHSFGGWVKKVAPTETKVGTEERYCKFCNKIETREIPKLVAGHSHSYTSSVTKAATCESEGTKTFSCSCGAKYTETIAKLRHNYKGEVIKPTCTSSGYTKYTCSECGHSYNDEYKNATDHKYTEKRVEATCTAKGSITKACSQCGDTITTPIGLKAHTFKISYKVLNATQHQVVSTCSVCSTVETANENHTWGNWTTTKNPTLTAEGEKSRKCSVCGQTANESIPKLESAEQDVQQRILELVNIEREKEGLKPLSYYNAGQVAADIRAQEIIESFSHTRPDGSTCFTVLEGIDYWGAGENIAIGYRSPEHVMEGWMNSQGHKENILRSHFTHLIVGYDEDAKAWVQLFLAL